ncbi:hypothetical protein GGF31_006462 [Allomyces arbusculus]|nr:hypothetical protein GGF31_006462 [Allomyces arbusculus]
MSGAANRRPATPAAGSIATPALPPASPASPAQAAVARPRPLQTAESDRIREERLWSDRVARELAAQRDFDQAWGFMLPHHASRAEALRDRRAKQGLTVDPFNVHSILHPPARAPAVPIPTATHAPKALVGGVTAAAVMAAESAPPPVRALLLNQHLDESTHRHQSVYKAAYTAAPVPIAAPPVSPPRKPPGTKAWGSPERRAHESDPAVGVSPRACGRETASSPPPRLTRGVSPPPSPTHDALVAHMQALDMHDAHDDMPPLWPVALPDRAAALPNKKDLARGLRALVEHKPPAAANGTAASPRPVLGLGLVTDAPTVVPPGAPLPRTSNIEYGWLWNNTPALEVYGSTSADHRRAHAQGRGGRAIGGRVVEIAPVSKASLRK